MAEAGAGCQVTSPLRKANATASDRLATPSLERIWLTWVLIVDGLTTITQVNNTQASMSET